MKIGLLSDTHGFILPALFDFFAGCDELWHAGDIGNAETLHRLQSFKPVRAVYGNIDGQDVRTECPEYAVFNVEGISVCMIHVGGYPGHYSPQGKQLIQQYHPRLFISGHSHILKVMRDEQFGLLHLNPGAAGYHGWQKFTTALRFDIKRGVPANLEVYQIDRNQIAKGE